VEVRSCEGARSFDKDAQQNPPSKWNNENGFVFVDVSRVVLSCAPPVFTHSQQSCNMAKTVSNVFQHNLTLTPSDWKPQR
jgi:hypothetical protein